MAHSMENTKALLEINETFKCEVTDLAEFGVVQGETKPLASVENEWKWKYQVHAVCMRPE